MPTGTTPWAWRHGRRRRRGSGAEAAEVAELNLQDAAWWGEEVREYCDRPRGETEEGVAAALARFRAEEEEARAEVVGAAAAELAAEERRRAEGAEAHASALATKDDR